MIQIVKIINHFESLQLFFSDFLWRFSPKFKMQKNEDLHAIKPLPVSVEVNVFQSKLLHLFFCNCQGIYTIHIRMDYP